MKATRLEGWANWHEDAADNRHAVLEQADRNSPQRQAGREIGGAIDRVQHPHEFRIGGNVIGVLLAKHAVRWESVLELLAKEGLQSSIQHGYRVVLLAALELQSQLAAKSCQRLLARGGR